MSNISKYDPGQELSSLDFGNLIGGPLAAVVDAQIQAAESTVKYIKNVGFDENGDPNYVAFTYPKEISPYIAGEPHTIQAIVTAPGSGYNVIPEVVIEGDGNGAEAEAVMQDDGSGNNTMEIKEIIITKQGFNYTKVDNIKVLNPGSDTAATGISLVVTSGKVTGVNISGGKTGSGYTHPPILEITSSGSGAELEAVINNDGEVVNVIIVKEGSGYSSGDTVVISESEGIGATATVNFTSGTPSQAAQFMDMKLEVPLLTMVPIPYVRIDETTINFNAKINSVEKISSENSFGFSFDGSYERKGSSSRTKKKKKATVKSSSSSTLKLNASLSYKRTDTRNTNIEKTYSMAVQVRAVQEEIPAGMEKVLGILENTIVSQPQ